MIFTQTDNEDGSFLPYVLLLHCILLLAVTILFISRFSLF